MKKTLEWYAVKGLFRWFFKDTGTTDSVEERIVLFRAAGFDEALDKAEAEATEYCREDPRANFKIEPMGWWNARRIGEDKLQAGTEVYSRLARTRLSGKSFIGRYYPKSHTSDA